MVYSTTETSIQDGAPATLFKFTGSYVSFMLTDWDENITNSSGTWTAETISHNDIDSGTQEDSNIALEVDIRASHQLVIDYAINEPPPSLNLQVYRVHSNDWETTELLWDGEVISWSIEGRTAKMVVPSIFAYLLNGPLPGPKYQGPCNHTLGDARCKVDMTSAANSYTATVVSVTGSTVVIDASSFPDGECNAGQMINATGDERRLIVSNTGTTFTLASAFSNLSVSDVVTIKRGCNHSFSGDCITKFANGAQFGGFPLVPGRNPYSGRL